MKIPTELKHILDKEHYLIVSTLDKDGTIHTSAKGILEVDSKGKIFILDLYKGNTYKHIKNNPNVTLTTVDEHRFRGYSIEGKAKIKKEDSLPKNVLKDWHGRLAKRIAKRVIKHVKEEMPEHKTIPEAKFPLPKYLIEVSVNKIIDLAPHSLKSK